MATGGRDPLRGLIRPEAGALLRRWAETITALAVLALGLWWAATAYGLVRWIGWAVAALGVAMTLAAVQRLRFRAEGEGPGVVQVIEGEIRYFGPSGGGFMSLDSLRSLALSGDGAAWLLTDAEGQRLAIPRAARGAEALFDAFAALPGLDMARLLRMTAQDPDGSVRAIWRRPARGLLT